MLQTRLSRRQFLRTGAAAGTLAALPWRLGGAPAPAARPNVLWVSAEDLSPDLGCYGDPGARTPHVDGFSQEAARFTRAFSHMGVCAPARSGIITGMYPTAMGTNPMRCSGVPPEDVRCFPEYLRALGYYCSNRAKTDYQFAAPPSAWDVCGPQGHWSGRAPGQPFFAVINLGTTHEGQIRSPARREQLDRELAPEERHAPAAVVLPPYHPDTPLVRRDWAQYHDLITLMDREFGRILDDLEKDGLAEDTIVWFWGDHGRGLPRCKRWIYDSGLRFPLLIRVPPRWREWVGAGAGPGTVNDELVGFVDFAPTMLSLCGAPLPEQVHGRAFLGPAKAPEPAYLFAGRDRVDEAPDLIRGVRDRRFKYIRNFMPHLPRSQEVAFMDQMPTMQEMRRLHAAGQLPAPAADFFACPKPVEELYDCDADPHEVANLANDPRFRDRLETMRAALLAWMLHTGDTGLIPEPEFDAAKRPGDRMATTSTPGIQVRRDNDGGVAAELTCATPGASMVYSRRRRPPETDTAIRLDYTEAQVHGDGLRRTPDQGIIGWRDTGTWISWAVHIPAAGTYPVHVLSACQGRAGSRYRLSVGDAGVEAQVEDTGGWYNHRFFHIGDVPVPAAGTYTVALRPLPQERAYSMNLRGVVLGAPSAVAAAAADTPWQLYSGPVPLAAGDSLAAAACRLGFRDSPEVVWSPGDADLAPGPAPEAPHWRGAFPRDLIEAILALKATDGRAAAAAACRAALASTHAAVRYWAVIGLAAGPVLGTHDLDAADHERLGGLLSDPSASVRIAAAQALGAKPGGSAAVALLARELETNPLASGRWLAAVGLQAIGEAARPALEAVRRLQARDRSYTGRVCTHILTRLGEAPGPAAAP